MRINKLFYTLVFVVVSLLTIELYREVEELLPKEMEIDHHEMYITYPMLKFVNNRDQLAVIIGHEFGHIILGHTVDDKHEAAQEYHADMVGAFLAHKAGYSLCGMDHFWRRVGEEYLSLYTDTHPNVFIRSYYMEMSECKGLPIKQEVVTIDDAYEVFSNIAEHVEGSIKYRTHFGLYFLTLEPNAFVFTKMKEVRK